MDIKLFNYIQTLKYNKKFSKYIEIYFNNEPIKLKYDPSPIQNDDFDSFEMDYISNHFTYSSRKNLIFRKFHEDIYDLASTQVKLQRKGRRISTKPSKPSNRRQTIGIKGGGIALKNKNMDGYGLCIDSHININKELLSSFINALNILPNDI